VIAQESREMSSKPEPAAWLIAELAEIRDVVRNLGQMTTRSSYSATQIREQIKWITKAR
jgi:hypothetical protein